MIVLKHLFVVIISYLILAFLTMGIVLLFFFEQDDYNIVLVVLTQILFIPTTAYFLIQLASKWLKINTKLSSLILGALLTIVAGLNLYLNVSIEPAWFVLVNLMLALTGLFLAGKFTSSVTLSES